MVDVSFNQTTAASFCKPVKDLVAEIENLSGENKMLVDLLKNEKHQLQEELQKYKEIQQNLQVKASKLAKSMLVTGLRCWGPILNIVLPMFQNHHRITDIILSPKSLRPI